MTQRRPPIPQHVKDLVWDRENGICQECGEPVEEREHAEYDHRPALSARQNRQEFPRSSPRHYVPNAHDPQWLRLLHGKKSGLPCHNKATFGDGVYRGDVSNAAKSKRIHKKWGAPKERTTSHGYALLKKADKPSESVRPKAKIRSRGFPQKSRKLRGRQSQDRPGGRA